MYELDELKVYRGEDIQINKSIVVTQHSIDDIRIYGERQYFQAVHTLTSVGADLKWQLWDMGIDYTTIDDYDLFIQYICRMVSSGRRMMKVIVENPEKYAEELKLLTDEKIEELSKNPMELVLQYVDGDEFDFCDFVACKSSVNDEPILYNQDKDVTIDKLCYQRMVDAVRMIHGFKRNNEIPANERTKMDLIDDARDDAIMNANKPYKSVLKSLVSTLSIKTGQLGSESIWNTKINMFFDAVKRISKLQDAESLMTGAYSGFANLKGIDKERFNLFSDI